MFDQDVRNFLNQYEDFLVNAGYVYRERAVQKLNDIYSAITRNLSGIIGHRYATYKKLGSDKGYRYFSYTDKSSGTDWVFAFEDFGNNNYLIRIMNVWDNINETKDIVYINDGIRKSIDFMWRLLKV